MKVESIALVMPQSAWAFLLQWQGVTDAWMLPAEEGADPALGAAWLREQELLIAGEGQALLDSGLERWGEEIAQASFGLDVKTADGQGMILRVPDGWIGCRWLSGARLSAAETRQPLRTLREWARGEEALYGIRKPDAERWLCRMPWLSAEPWLRNLLGKD